MRYLKPALVGLVGGLLLAGPVLTAEFIHAKRKAELEFSGIAARTRRGTTKG